jgi:hypothetical protein
MEKSTHIKVYTEAILNENSTAMNRHIILLIIHLDCIISKEKISRMKLNPSIKYIILLLI